MSTMVTNFPTVKAEVTHSELVHSLVDLVQAAYGSNTNGDVLQFSDYGADIVIHDLQVIQQQVNTAVAFLTTLLRKEDPAI